MYTIGIKRRVLPGFKLYKVTAHSYADFRFIFNLADGSQITIPLSAMTSMKVYADFWTHLHEKKSHVAEQEAAVDHIEEHRKLLQKTDQERRQSIEKDEEHFELDRQTAEEVNQSGFANRVAEPRTPTEALRRATDKVNRMFEYGGDDGAERVGRILPGTGQQGQVGAGPVEKRPIPRFDSPAN